VCLLELGDVTLEQGFWFKSDMFEIVKDEDTETNSGCYGESLANWVCKKLSVFGYQTEVIPEDWGWCVMCQSSEYLLWVGCGSMLDEEIDDDNVPSGSEVTWHVFPVIEVPFFMPKSKIRSWLGRLDTKGPLLKLRSELNEVLNSEPNVTFCAEP
jgi:hypothetical protein